MSHKLTCFISSTGDLSKWRIAAKNTLKKIDLEGSLFEEWPSSPNAPIKECFQKIMESDAFILLLGRHYGSINESGLSATHMEFRYAKKNSKPIFVYLIGAQKRDPNQVNFIKEVESCRFRCKLVLNQKKFEEEIKNSLIQEFTRCFHQVHAPDKNIPDSIQPELNNMVIPTDSTGVYELLLKLYNSRKDLEIKNLADDIEKKYSKNPGIMQIIYCSEVNLGINGYPAKKQRLKDALDYWSRAKTNHKSILYNQGNALLALKNYSEAISKYKESLSLDDTNAEGWKNLGSAYNEIDNIESAFECFENALKFKPQLFEALLSLAKLLIEKKDNADDSLKYLNRIITSKLSPQQISIVNCWKAYACLKIGKYAEGIAFVEDAIVIDAENNWTWRIAGRLYALIWRQDKNWLVSAMKFWEKFTEKFPEKAEAWGELGFIQFTLGKKSTSSGHWGKAITAFLKAIELGFEDDGLVWDRIGHLYQVKSLWSYAENAYRNAVLKSPEKFGYCLGVSLIYLNRFNEALPLVLDAAERHQPDAMSWFQVGVCYDRLGKLIEAEKAYKKSLLLVPDYQEAWFNLGGVYWNMRLRGEAKKIWEEAIRRFPKNKSTKIVLELLNSLEAKTEAEPK